MKTLVFVSAKDIYEFMVFVMIFKLGSDCNLGKDLGKDLSKSEG